MGPEGAMVVKFSHSGHLLASKLPTFLNIIFIIQYFPCTSVASRHTSRNLPLGPTGEGDDCF